MLDGGAGTGSATTFQRQRMAAGDESWLLALAPVNMDTCVHPARNEVEELWVEVGASGVIN